MGFTGVAVRGRSGMAGHPGTGNPALPAPEPGPASAGAAAPVAGSAPPAADSPSPPAGSGGRPKLPRKKIVIPAVLAALAVLLGLGAWLLYPATAQLPSRGYTTMVFNAPFGIDALNYQIHQVRTDLAEIKIAVLFNTSKTASVPHQLATLSVYPPLGDAFHPCPPAYCGRGQNATYAWFQILTFRPGTGPGELPDTTASGIYAFLTLYVRAHDFGVTYNNVNASAALPKLYYNAPGFPNLVTQYSIGSADLYDWSSLPPAYANGARAVWLESPSSGLITPVTATGVNHASSGRNTTLTFIAGALLGLAGGALLSAIQEALHARD
jgi:hypothetical protein